MNCQGPTAQRRAKKYRDRMNRMRAVYRKVDERDGIWCRVCRLIMRLGVHHHHIIPRSLGGKDTTENIASVCPQCHLDIHAKRVIVTGNADEQLQIVRVA